MNSRVTLGDLVVSAFEKAGRFTGDAALAAWLASREVEARLQKAGRLDLIRALASGWGPTRQEPTRRAVDIGVSRRHGLAGNVDGSFAAAG